ncbi:hypothetical protein E2C01_012920 [Portunus trituberculatus]|uniref:Uncharacterized protein n=1 Tax=Portunus trituberculatus TaxID=210409 RepID=A0A5B7DF52_PORTR|nr:hypothetical protein [Portunus trituberculatus]
MEKEKTVAKRKNAPRTDRESKNRNGRLKKVEGGGSGGQEKVVMVVEVVVAEFNYSRAAVGGSRDVIGRVAECREV